MIEQSKLVIDIEPEKVYVAGPMRGFPQFNFPAFFSAAKELEEAGYKVFNPAARDEDEYGKDFAKDNSKGCEEEAAQKGFSLREALASDMAWICLEATHIYMLRGWEKSKGAIAEHALATALGHTIMYESVVE